MSNLQYEMSEIEEKIYNKGERLIPGVSHDERETKRHASSYNFFVKLIEEDVHTRSICPIVVDLGCGVGFGCKIMSNMNGSVIIGVDISEECLEYATKNYFASNIVYRKDDLRDFIKKMSIHDYVVSRGVLEHIEDGLELAKKVKFRHMFIFDVPYNEGSINPHHKVTGVTEETLKGFEYAEIYYEDLQGNITKEKPEAPNMIMCVCKKLVHIEERVCV